MTTIFALWKQSKIKCIITIISLFLSATLVGLGASNFYQEGPLGPEDLAILLPLLQLPHLFLYWGLRLFWRGATSMKNNAVSTFAANIKAQRRLLGAKLFVLTTLIVAHYLLALLLYVLINKGSIGGISFVVWAETVGVVIISCIYVYDFLRVNRIRDSFRSYYGALAFSGCFFLVAAGDNWWVPYTVISAAAVLAIVGFILIWREYS